MSRWEATAKLRTALEAAGIAEAAADAITNAVDDLAQAAVWDALHPEEY